MRPYTIEEAAEILRCDNTTVCNLVRRRKIGYYKTRPVTISEDHIKAYQKSIEVNPCAANQNLSSSGTKTEASNPRTGTSNITTAEVNASLLGVSLARKTMKRFVPSQHSSSSVKGQQHGSQIG